MRRLIPLLLASLLAGCTWLPIDTRYRSVGQDSRVQFLVLHYTNSGFERSLQILTKGRVSSHYLVDREPPVIYRLVDEDRRAWHAGLSSWQGYTHINAASIGIEIVNDGFDAATGTWQEYPEGQVRTVLALVRDIAERHQIRPDRIVGHSDIAPQRKVDPGPLFPWKRLADEGLIPWPDAAKVAQRRAAFEAAVPDTLWFQRALEKHGFAVPVHGELDEPTRRVIAAFQMKYRPSRHDGVPDAETAAMLDVLVAP